MNKLERQCAELNIPLDTLVLPREKMEVKNSYTKATRTVNGWVFDGKLYQKSEQAALAYYESIGYKGVFDEGNAAKALMKSACLDLLAELHYQDRSWARSHFFSAQCCIYENHLDLFVEAVRQATPELIQKHLQEILGPCCSYFDGCAYSYLPIETMMEIWNSIGSEGWTRFAKAFVAVKWSSSSGWPDLTIVQGKYLRFVEVKTSSSSLGDHQARIISKCILSPGYHASVIRLVSQK